MTQAFLILVACWIVSKFVALKLEVKFALIILTILFSIIAVIYSYIDPQYQASFLVAIMICGIVGAFALDSSKPESSSERRKRTSLKELERHQGTPKDRGWESSADRAGKDQTDE